MPSQELLNEFSRFDDETLKKLITIGDSIISPMEGELVNVDFASMVDAVFKDGGLADTHFPEWTDRSKSDFGRFLVELMALFSDKDFFYINHFSREGFIGQASQYKSIFHSALHHGLNPTYNKSATGTVSLVFSAGAEEIVPRGAINLGIQDVPELVYTNLPFSINSSSTSEAVTVEFIHGTQRNEEYKFDGHSIILDTNKIAAGTIELLIDDVVWTETDNFSQGNSSTKHFMVFYDELGRAEIYFASGGLGAKPALNQICQVSFIIGGGYLGDIGDGVLNLILGSQTTRNLESFEQFEMTGGNDLIGKERLRQLVIGEARTQNRVVTPEDAEYFAKKVSFVHKVHSEAILNYTYVYVLPTSGGTLSQSQKDQVHSVISEQLLMGFNLTVESPIYVPITLSVDIYLLPTAIRSSSAIVASQVIDEYLNPLRDGEFGEGVNRSSLSARILQRIQKSSNVVFTTLHRSGTPEEPNDLDFINSELIDVENSTININLIGGI
tara:strand:+ start:41216 stop:42709 length:1494 start_codon:yes stop_codon:yes gene_type:complete